MCNGVAAGLGGGCRGSKGSRANRGVKRGAVLRFSSGYGEGSKLGKDWDAPEGVGGGSPGDRECGGMRRDGRMGESALRGKGDATLSNLI
uniref:Uncharacterized protein n=1 Tax=Chromera velia CCMP2878 TaxID=1169474 RepID=A0A0G4HT41_9ALVE|eukprot:Cvel_31248.t1-p1 / transcript=Cvel_31248.t1 / gene=Cvel_31248 / organism=Chromera_velia_CCMP2878 / gene_product=hypothetical protein / transcript_product=hypothetical protein / location=Cvel_scaffold4622:5737-6003(-) / protein_length=89 / sequence_SO=supercontig / SO=protein_coding / is_pseudo=false